MTNNQHGQVPEALIDLIDAYAETRHRCGGIYNAKTEAARNAVIEALSGVQALSAAPEAFLKSVIALCSHRGYSPANIEAWDKDDKWIADLWRQAESMLAATPTPPAEQQAAPTAAQGELSADSLRHQNKLLAETLGACILASGIVRKDIDGFTGPELLHFGEDLRSMLEAAPQPAPAEQEEAAQRLRKTLDIDPGDVNDPLHPRYIAGFKSGHAAGRRRAVLAASPTPPAEQ